MKDTILYIDDERGNLDTFWVVFHEEYELLLAKSAAEGYKLMERHEIKVAIVDQRMPQEDGIKFISNVKTKYPNVVYMILSGYADFDIAINAINQNAVYRFILKPWKENEVRLDIDNAIHLYNLRQKNRMLYDKLTKQNLELTQLKERLEAENYYLKEEIKLTKNFENIICVDGLFKKVLNQIEQVAGTEASVLISGETGTGKELLARAIHNLSSRHNKPFIGINCAAIPESLIESELFGFEKGAFTGAIRQKIGKFELANGGTLFLDEIGEIPVNIQSKLLRVLQENEFERIGGNKVINTDIRIISATNKKLEKEIENGSFRSDLYYRLNVFPIMVPPLRDRKKDIPELVNFFIKKYNGIYRKNITSLPRATINKLVGYSWPGNIRELENIIERAVILSNTNQLNIETMIPEKAEKAIADSFSLEQVEKNHIIKVLDLVSWRISGNNGAAKMLGLNRTTLHSKMKKLGINKVVKLDER